MSTGAFRYRVIASGRKKGPAAAYREITQDPERAYVLNYLATQQLLPAYQFPVETFGLEPGVPDTPTIYRAAYCIEFAGNFVYVNGHKRGPFECFTPADPVRSAELRAAARRRQDLQAFHFCDACDEAVESGHNACPHCGHPPGQPPMSSS